MMKSGLNKWSCQGGIVGERMKLRRDEQGIVLMGIYEFFANQDLLDV